MQKVLIIASEGVEETELYAVADILVRAELEVTIAGVASTSFKGSRGLPVAANTVLSEVTHLTYDLIYVPGGLGQANTMKSNTMVQTMIANQLSSGRMLSIICASPIALIPNELAKDRTITSYPSFENELSPHVKAWVDEAVVIDGNLVTSQGPGTAIALGLKLAEILAGSDVRDGVAKGMLVK